MRHFTLAPGFALEKRYKQTLTLQPPPVRVQAATVMYRAWQMSVDTDTLQRRTTGLVLADVRVMSDTLTGMGEHCCK